MRKYEALSLSLSRFDPALASRLLKIDATSIFALSNHI